MTTERGQIISEALCALMKVSAHVTHFRMHPDDFNVLVRWVLPLGHIQGSEQKKPRFLGNTFLERDPRVERGFVVMGMGDREILAEYDPIWEMLHGIPSTRFQRLNKDIVGEEPLDPALKILLQREVGPPLPRFSSCRSTPGMMSLDLPPDVGPAREQAIREYVRNSNFEVSWAKVTSTHGEHTGEFWVFADALKIDGVRVNVSAETEQIIADLLGCTLLTAKLADMIWAQRAITLPPFPRQITATTQAMIEHSAKIDAALLKAGYTEGLIATVGKHWLIDNDLLVKAGRAMNYGWHFAGSNFQGIKGEVVATLMKDQSGQYERLIQGRGTAHDMHHADYSQTCVLASRECIVDGQTMDIFDVFRSPDLAPLVSHQGVLKLFRQPGVAKEKAIVSPEVVRDDDSSNA